VFQTGASVGEIWHESYRSDAELLVKHIFTSERLSIQVHPPHDAAVARGHPWGKDEAWLVVDAKPGAVIGLGLTHEVDRAELLAAALDGKIEHLLEWRPVRPGDFFYSKAGTVHAIGAGVTVVEIQQNLDLTYRLFDYGRSRELHLEEGISVAELKPWSSLFKRFSIGGGRSVLACGDCFVVEEWLLDRQVWADGNGSELLFIPIEGASLLDGEVVAPGSVFSTARRVSLLPDGPIRMLVAYSGASVQKAILQT
jgi:mannose-6-phosphate isomerase